MSKKYLRSFWADTQLCQNICYAHLFHQALAEGLKENYISFHSCNISVNEKATASLINLNNTCPFSGNSFRTNSFKESTLSCTLISLPKMVPFWTFGVNYILISKCKKREKFNSLRSLRRLTLLSGSQSIAINLPKLLDKEIETYFASS